VNPETQIDPTEVDEAMQWREKAEHSKLRPNGSTLGELVQPMAEQQDNLTYDPVIFCGCLDQAAKWWWACSLFLKLAGFLFGAIIILLTLPSKPVPYVIALVTLLSEAAILRSDSIKGVAQSLRRKIDFEDGLGWTISREEYSDLIMRSPASVKIKACNKPQAESYFASNEPPGPRRALQNVTESPWWSKHLAEKMGQYCATVIVVATVLAFVILVMTLEGSSVHDTASAVSRVVTSVLMLVLSLGLVKMMLGYFGFAKKSEKAEQKAIEALKAAAPSDVDAVKVMNDYHIPRASAPILPTWVWKWHRDELNKTWKELRM